MGALGPIKARTRHWGLLVVCSEQIHQFPQNSME